MPSTLIATPGAVDANAYCSVARARQYYDDTPGSGDLTVSLMLTSSVASATLITTAAAHNLATGDVVVLANHAGSTPSLNGTRTVTVLSATTFTIPVTVTVAGTGGTVAADDKLTRALLTATRLIDDKFAFDGVPTNVDQALAWPRRGLLKWGGAAQGRTAFDLTTSVALLDATTIPGAVEAATAELGRQLLKNTRLMDANNDLAGVTRIKAGRAFEIEFADSANLAPTIIPDNVARMLTRWGQRIGKTGVLKLIRA